MDTATALSSEAWLGISLESVQEFLRMDSIDAVEEVDLVRALIRWGKFQLQTGGDKFDGEKMRRKINAGLHLIRFSALTSKQFANLCLEEFGAVLTAEEKHLIMMSIVTGDSSLMPPDVVIYNYPARERKRDIVVKFPLDKTRQIYKFGPFAINVKFELSKKSILLGIKLICPKIQQNVFSFELRESNKDELMWRGFLDPLDEYHCSLSGEEFYDIGRVCSLDAHTTYVLTISYPYSVNFEMFSGKLNNYFVVTSDGLTLKFWNLDGFCIVEAMKFEI
jgi:hypothetical protein